MTESNNDQNAAHRLVGQTLEGGWVVYEKIEKKRGQTGGNFSVGYRARKQDSKIAHVKALDLTWAFQQKDRLRQIETATRDFNFEADLYRYCNSKSMSNIVSVIEHGSIKIDNSPLGEVDYIIFEPAGGDLRSVLLDFSVIELYWVASVLHEAANGLRQLHASQIAHQDLKPSNILAFINENKFKLADLGSASRRQTGGPRDAHQWAGEWYVAPPEHQYNELSSDWFLRRIPGDLYALGSLIIFLFTGFAIYSIAVRHLPDEMNPERWTGSFREVLPFLKDAYAKAFEEVSHVFDGRIQNELFVMARELCEPDPTLRGWKKYQGTPVKQYSMERYLSKLGNIRKLASYSLNQKIRYAHR